jgi:hypothetical protein
LTGVGFADPAMSLHRYVLYFSCRYRNYPVLFILLAETNGMVISSRNNGSAARRNERIQKSISWRAVFRFRLFIAAEGA